MSPARARTQTARSRVKCTNHEATAPPLCASVWPPTNIMHYHWLLQVSFILGFFKFFKIVDDSLSCLTTRMMVHDSLCMVRCFLRKSAGLFKMAAKSSSWGSAATSEICVYFQGDNHDKENIEYQDTRIIKRISSEESVNSQELEETPPKKKRITKHSSGEMGNSARWNNGLILRLTNRQD